MRIRGYFSKPKRGPRAKKFGKHFRGAWTSIQSVIFGIRLLGVVESVTKKLQFRRRTSILFQQGNCLAWPSFLYCVTSVHYACSRSLQPVASRLKLGKALSTCEWMNVF